MGRNTRLIGVVLSGILAAGCGVTSGGDDASLDDVEAALASSPRIRVLDGGEGADYSWAVGTDTSDDAVAVAVVARFFDATPEYEAELLIVDLDDLASQPSPDRVPPGVDIQFGQRVDDEIWLFGARWADDAGTSTPVALSGSADDGWAVIGGLDEELRATASEVDGSVAGYLDQDGGGLIVEGNHTADRVWRRYFESDGQWTSAPLLVDVPEEDIVEAFGSFSTADGASYLVGSQEPDGGEPEGALLGLGPGGELRVVSSVPEVSHLYWCRELQADEILCMAGRSTDDAWENEVVASRDSGQSWDLVEMQIEPLDETWSFHVRSDKVVIFGSQNDDPVAYEFPLE